ncbi:hypothetical protein R5R35_002876 [Gryllus longicercus]|uniref:Accessory gland protein n=1 Tax=Gryllus longicercus TaxID=2509291 RepID=A0AAN9Z3A4_9ORTH
MGAAAAAAVVLLGVAVAAIAVAATTVATTTTRSPTGMPLYMTKAPKLDRAHKNKFLVEAPCTQYCKNVVWQYKEVGDSTWKWADAEAHSSFPDTFYLRRLRPDTLYVLRALLKPNFGPAYAGDEIPTLEARTCPEQPPPVENLRAHSAGPGWQEVRWMPTERMN